MKHPRDKRRDSRPQPPRKGASAPMPARDRQERQQERQPDHRPAPRQEQQIEAKAEPRKLVRREGALPAERLPLILEVAPNDDYALLDSGDGQKLEQYGPYRIVRPEGQAIWQPALPASGMGKGRRHLHRRHRRGRHGPLALSEDAARRDLADAP